MAGAALGVEAVAAATVPFTKEALKKEMGPLDETPGRSSAARVGMTEARGGLRSQRGGKEHAPGLRREGLARGRNMPAQIARTGVLSERSKRKKRRAAGDLGQDPDEMVTAGAQLALMVAPARLAGGNMGTGAANLNLICEGIEEGVVKRRGEVGEAALTSGGAEGLTVLRMTRMGSRSGAWTMRTKKWAPLMPLEPSCPSRKVPRNPFLRSRSWISRVWRKMKRSLVKDWMRRGLRLVGRS